ncbi:MAG: universal stress protein, partial [Gammaproteobacteria bacterium]|nr:universal stress protein [Gammaproteobacteria bacterium]
TEGFVRAADGYLDVNRIVVPVDASPSPAPALRLAGRVARRLSDTQVAVDVVHAGAVPPPGLELPADDDSTRWTFRLLDGEPARIIRAAANGADLLVMSTAGRYDLQDMLLGSTAERVLEGAPCPLLTVPAARR